MRERKILVVKVGTSTLLGKDEQPSSTFEYVAESIMRLQETYNVALVTSGAIGFGVTRLGLTARPESLEKLQALSMIGQVGLLRQWREAFGDTTLGQVLITRRDLEKDSTAQSFLNSVEEMWHYGGMPIINENDAVSTEEISFGDNDRLAAEIADVLGAEVLMLLTDQNGIQANYETSEQHRLETATVKEALEHVQPVKSIFGRGGASSKLQAAQLALDAGCTVYISHAGLQGSIEDTLTGKVGTKLVQ